MTQSLVGELTNYSLTSFNDIIVEAFNIISIFLNKFNAYFPIVYRMIFAFIILIVTLEIVRRIIK